MPPRRTTPANPGNRGRKTKIRTDRPVDVELTQRRALACELRRAGFSFEKVAEEVHKRWPGTPGGYDRASAYRDVRAMLEAIVEEPAREVLGEELDRLNAMLSGLWSKATRGDVNAIDRVLKLMDQRARYLGLYSPIKQQLVGPGGGAIQVANVTDPDAVFEVARAALSQAIEDHKERQAPRALQAVE